LDENLLVLHRRWRSTPPICDNPDMPNQNVPTQKSVQENVELLPVQIRTATEADAPLLYDLIRKLAEYGDISDEVSATEADVRAAISGPHPLAEAILAYVGDEPAGFAMYSFSFASFLGKPGIYIEDFFVEQAHRNRSIGKRMLVYLAKLGRERGCGRLEWSVLNWNEGAMEFYQSFGAVAMDEWTTFRLTGEALERLATHGGI
jgi:GNAT superfamily N-acetyltransferase